MDTLGTKETMDTWGARGTERIGGTYISGETRGTKGQLVWEPGGWEGSSGNTRANEGGRDNWGHPGNYGKQWGNHGEGGGAGNIGGALG